MESKASFKAEMEWLKEEVLKIKCDIALGHGDCWWGNIVYDNATGDYNIQYFKRY